MRFGTTVMSIAVVAALGLTTACTSRESAATAQQQASAKLVADAPRFAVPVSVSQPKRGPDTALVTVVEWADLASPPAADAARVMDELMAQYPADLRLVHRHQTLPDNEDSMLLHSFARAAHTTLGKFWEVRAQTLALPSGQPVTAEQLGAMASSIGMDWDRVQKEIMEGVHARQVAADLRFAKMFGATRSPTFYVNGKRVPYVPSAELKATLDAFIRAELENAKKLVQSGTAPEAVYEAVIADAKWNEADDPVKRKAAQQMSMPTAAPKAAL